VSNSVNGGAVALLVVLIAAVGGGAIWVFTRMRSA
jgi:hypothetical protein